MSDPKGSEAPSLAERLDRQVHAVEGGLVTGALLVMALTYFLTIVYREMRAETSAFDRLFLDLFFGFGTVQEAKDAPEVLARVKNVVTPLILGAFTFGMAILAVRTRERVDLEPGAEPPPVRWGRRLGLAAVSTAVAYGALKVIEVTPARVLCLVALLAMLGPAVVITWRRRALGGLAGAALGGGLMAWFFATKVEQAYLWSAELSSVLLMYVGFIGASMATRERRHIRVDFVRKNVPPRFLNLYNALGGLVTVLFIVFLLVLATQYLSSQMGHGSMLQATGLPEYAVSLPIALALVLMAVRFAGQALADLRGFLRGEVPAPTGPEIH